MKLTISAKCSDLCFASVEDDNGSTIWEQDGYVPRKFQIGGGDYVEFTLDLATGKILHFVPMTEKDIHNAIAKERE